MASLRLATPEEQLERDALTHQAWGQQLTVDAFRARELALRGHRWARSAMRGWWWVDATGAVLASCETFDIPAMVGDTAGRAAVIASVFTAPELRGQGHARDMLRALVPAWAASPPLGWASSPTPLALTLFSEVGAPFYATLGYVEVPAFHVLVPARRMDRAPLPECPVPAWRRAPRGIPGRLDLERTLGQLDWQLERERQYAALLGRRRPGSSSATLDGGSIGWTAAFKAGELHVLWLDAGESEPRGALLAAARDAAGRAGLSTVRLWVDGPGAWPATEPDATVEAARDIPMYFPLVDGVRSWAPVERALWA